MDGLERFPVDQVDPTLLVPAKVAVALRVVHLMTEFSDGTDYRQSPAYKAAEAVLVDYLSPPLQLTPAVVEPVQIKRVVDVGGVTPRRNMHGQ